MSPENFAYWLQGFVEIAKRMPTPEEWVEITNHLKTVFHKVTPTAAAGTGASRLFPSGITWPVDGVSIC